MMILSFLISFTFFAKAQANDASCLLKSTYDVHIVGEFHGSQMSQDLQNVLIPAALNHKITLGLEIDEVSLHKTLAPQFYDSLFATEELISKGFGLTLWAWRSATWTLIKNQVEFIQQIENQGVDDAVSSFLFFLNNNPTMIEAVRDARTRKLDQLAEKNEDLKRILTLVDTSVLHLATANSPLFEGVKNLEDLKTLNLFFKEVLRSYIGIINTSELIKNNLETPAMIGEFIKLIDHKDFDKNDPKFGVTIYNYDRLYRSLEARVLFDWRSIKMAKNVFAKLCAREAKNLPVAPVVVIAGAGHISHIEKILKQLSPTALRTTISVPPSSHSDFEKLFENLK